MGSSTETAAADSDGSISWEEFIGTTTDLLPQLLGMFDEIARGKADLQREQRLHDNHHKSITKNSSNSNRSGGGGGGNRNNNNNGQQRIVVEGSATAAAAALLQKRLSLVVQRQIENRAAVAAAADMAPIDLIRHADDTDDDDADGDEEDDDEDDGVVVYASRILEDSSSCRFPSPSNGVGVSSSSPERRCLQKKKKTKKQQRPVSGSSFGSSCSSSSCASSQGSGHHDHHHHRHHHHHHRNIAPSCTGGVGGVAANPYLASVESLADTCASSQGSGDSGVVTTISDNSSGKILLAEVERATAARYFDERRPRYCDPHLSPVERVLLEIVITEDDYVEDLLQVIQGYLIFWRNDPESLVQDFELNGLFSNIENIFEFNSKFLSALEKSGLDPVAVANTFIEHNTGFKVYTEYCTNYPRTVSILTDLMNQEKIGRAFRERQAALGHKLPLGSFLLKPVQRILKYHLLLDKLSKGFGAIEPEPSGIQAHEEGKAIIENALQAMNGIAEYINDMKRKHEHAVRVQEIQSLLYGWHGSDLTTSGELIAEGSFRMRGAKAPRHAFLFDKMLLLTKKREDGLLVYKAHILCSNLTLMESIPGEPLSFHVIPFDNSQIQYKLQARNLEQKREWTLQIKRVILENYSAVIPSHARQLVLQIGQKSEDDSTPERGPKKYSDYFERKSTRERRKSELGIRQKLKKGRKSDVSNSTAENSPMSPRKNQSTESISQFGSKDENLNRSSEIRGSKIKDRFTNWRRKSEPGFQSYIDLNPSENEDDVTIIPNGSITPTEDLSNKNCEANLESEVSESSTMSLNSPSIETKDNNDDEPISEQKSVEEIVSNILMQKKEFQKRLEKHLQRNPSTLHNSILKYNRQRQDTIIDSSEDEVYTDTEDKANNTSNSRLRSCREQCFVRAANAYNQRSFRSQYDSFRNIDAKDTVDFFQRLNSSTSSLKLTPRTSNHEKRSPGEALKKPNIIMGSKLMRTALRIREDCDSASEHDEIEEPIYETPSILKKDVIEKNSSDTYDNLEQHVCDGCLDTNNVNNQDSPNKAAVWLTKLCEGLPDQPQKCGSLPRSFQMMNPVDLNHVSKSRFLQRDGKSMTERPFTIASDKPAEINLEDMERYASNCQGSTRIAKFPTTSSTSTSTFFCSLEDASFTDTDSISRKTSLSTSTYVHPDHKIYRASKSSTKEINNGVTHLTASSLLSVFSRAGSRLRSSQSTEVLECTEEIDRSSRYFRSFGKRNKHKNNVTKSVEIEETIGCVPSNSKHRLDKLPYHKQGSSSIGARIAQSDYADPLVLFAERRKNLNNLVVNTVEPKNTNDEVFDTSDALEDDSFYEKSFETIENYVESQEEAFRDSAIFSDIDDSSLKSNENSTKVPPPIPEKKSAKQNAAVGEKPALAQKPAHLKVRARIVKSKIVSEKIKIPSIQIKANLKNNEIAKEDDISSGQNQVGYVKKMVGQLQAHVDA